MNLNAKVHPAFAALVIVATLLGLGFKVWADGKAKSFGGPAELVRDPAGHFYVQIRNQLLEHSAEGTFIRQHDLGELGVETLLGGIAFLPDGDLLVRRGKDPRSLLDTIRAYGRIENTDSLAPDEPGAGLAKCNLETKTCTSFGTSPIDFKATYSAFVDADNGRIYISDTSRHQVHVLSLNGELFATKRDGFRFPNDLLIHQGKLHVVNTNRHEIAVIEPGVQDFGRAIVDLDVVPDDAARAGLRWPSHFARINDEWWVNIMDTNMRDGGVFVFDDNWQPLRRVNLPRKADPIAILPFESGALISDWDNRRVYRVDRGGQYVTEFESSGLNSLLAEAAESSEFYATISWLGIALFVLVIIGMLVKGVMAPAEKPERSEPDEAIFADEPVRLEPSPAAHRRSRFGMVAMVAMLVVALVGFVVLSVQSGKPQMILWMLGPLVAFAGMVVFFWWFTRLNLGTSVDVEGRTLILRNSSGRRSRCDVNDALYTDNYVATPDMAVMLGQPNMRLYDKDEIERVLMPRLAGASKLSEFEMQKHLVRIGDAHGKLLIVSVIGFVLLAIGVLIANALDLFPDS